MRRWRLVSSRVTLDELFKLERRGGMYLLAPQWYPAIAGYLSGVERADPEVLYGFQEYVSVTYERNAVLAWPSALLNACGLEARQVGMLPDDPGEPEAHALAIRTLFSVLRDFAAVVEAGGLDAVIDEFDELSPLPPRPRPEPRDP